MCPSTPPDSLIRTLPPYLRIFGGLPELIRSAKFHWEILAKVSMVLCERFMHISFKGTCPIPTLIIVVTYHYFLYAWPWFFALGVICYFTQQKARWGKFKVWHALLVNAPT